MREGTPTTLIKLFFVLLTFISSIVFVRIMGATNYGIYSHVSAIIDVLKMPVEFGLPVLVLRETATNVARKNWGMVKGVWKWASNFIIISSMIIIGLCPIAYLIFGKHFSEEYIKTFLWGIMLIPFLAFSTLRGGQLKGLKKIVLSQFPEQVLTPVLQISIIIIYGYFLAFEVNASTTMIIYVISGVIAFFVGIGLLNKYTLTEIKQAEPVLQAKQWFSSTLNLAGINGLNLINKRISIIIVGLSVSAASVGYYKVAVQFSILASVGLQIINAIVSPRFAAMYTRNQMPRLQKIATLSARAVLVFNLVTTLLLALLGKLILSLAYGEEFIAAYIPILILLIGQFINSATGSVGVLLNMTGKEKHTIKGSFLATIINLILTLSLAPKFGIIGGAIGTGASLIVQNIFLWFAVYRHLGINCSAINFPKTKYMNCAVDK